jgi:hypothetical protein
MPKLPYYQRNTGKPWTDKDVQQLEKLAEQDTPTGVIGLKLGRTTAAVYTRGLQEGISLMPPNPHHKRK